MLDLTTRLGKKDLISMSEVSLVIDTYDDIFSDFDPRPYWQRALSDDFLQEAKRATRDKPSGKLELRFMIPRNKRDTHQEQLIKERLREHFKRHHKMLDEERRDIKIKGLTLTMIGVIFMMTTTTLLVKGVDVNFLAKLIIVILEPAGWFMFWEGMNLTIFDSKNKTPDFPFYNKMKECDIEFTSF